jgi:acetate kinase
MVSRILTVNAGSSSLKYAGFQVVGGELRTDTRTTGLVERIGEEVGHLHHIGQDGSVADEDVDVADPAAALLVMQEALGRELSDDDLMAVGHRVVHGAASFTEATVVDAAVEAEIARLAPLAPLHNPVNLAGIRSAARAFPGVPQVAVFDTAFHHTLPEYAYTYAVPERWRTELNVRRYGFHGTSHAYVARRAAAMLSKDPADVNVIVLHLGNGASACAVAGGVSVDTSMGLTPLEGLVMGTRSGDVDPALPAYLARVAGLDAPSVDAELNKHSGLLALAGSNDLRDILAAAEKGDEGARLAIDVYCYRIRKYVGAYFAALGHVDAVVFTAGVGENSPAIRATALAGLERLGIAVDPERNEAPSREERYVSPFWAETAVLVVPTDEEMEIAAQACGVVGWQAS